MFVMRHDYGIVIHRNLLGIKNKPWRAREIWLLPHRSRVATARAFFNFFNYFAMRHAKNKKVIGETTSRPKKSKERVFIKHYYRGNFLYVVYHCGNAENPYVTEINLNDGINVRINLGSFKEVPLIYQILSARIFDTDFPEEHFHRCKVILEMHQRSFLKKAANLLNKIYTNTVSAKSASSLNNWNYRLN